MKRRALIIYCDNTHSGSLVGPFIDNINYVEYLQSNLGGRWSSDEILSLRNPDSFSVVWNVQNFLNSADYSFVIFTGHGYIDTQNNLQHIELLNESISILHLRTTAKRQTLIVDACRGYYDSSKELLKSFSESFNAIGSIAGSTRQLFDDAVLAAEEGWTILFAADENQTALDTGNGGAYLYSLLKAARNWKKQDQEYNILGLNIIHDLANEYMLVNFATTQRPIMNMEKRIRYFPFAVKFTAQYNH